MVDGYWLERRLSRRRFAQFTGIAVAGAAAAAVIGCGDDDDAATTTPVPDSTEAPGVGAPPGDERMGGRLGYHRSGSSPNFNLVTNWTEGNYLSGITVYDRLIVPRLDERVYVLEAAESVEIADDTTIVFKLRDGLVYQDRDPINGRPVEAQDIVEFQYYCRDEDEAENNAFQRGSIETVEAPDDQTVVFNLQRPNAYMWGGTQFGQPSNQAIVPREMLADLEGLPPVGSGPFQVKDYQIDTYYLYERNPTYRRANEHQPYIDEREVFIIPDSSAQEAAFRGEQIHIWLETPPIESVDRVENDLGDQITVVEYESLAPFTWMVSARKEPWEDIRAREALYRLFNAQEFIDLVDDGRAAPAAGPLSGALSLYRLDPVETEEYRRHDPAEARQLLEAAGFDFGASYELITRGGQPRNDVGQQVWASQLNEVGIRVNIVGLPFSEWLGPRLGTGNYDFNLNIHPGYDTPQTPLRFHHSDPQHIIRHSNLADPEVDEMIDRSEVLLDPDEQIESVKQVQLELLRRYAPLNQINTNMLKQPRWAYLRDWEFTPAAYPFYRTEAWLET